MNQQKELQGSELFRWYLALLRSDAKLRVERMSMTPLTLVERDKHRIQELIEKSGKIRAMRSSELLQQLETKHAGALKMIKLVPGGMQIIDELITEIERARYGEQLIADYTTDLLCCLDEERLVLEINVEFELITGYQKLSIAAVPIDKLIAADELPNFLDYLEARKRREDRPPHECRVQTSRGELIDLQWHVEWSENSRAYFCRAKDITARKQRERLRDEVARMARHDLRTPLTGIGLVLDNIQLGIYGSLSDAGTEKVAQARETIDRMVDMIDNLINSNKPTE